MTQLIKQSINEENLEAEIETGIAVGLAFLLLQPNKDIPTAEARITIDVLRNRQEESFPLIILWF